MRQTEIPTYVINLKKRTDRKKNILKEFQGRDEFLVNVVEAFEHSFGALGLWMTIRYILQDLAPKDEDFIIICEDDLEFTADYSKEYLLRTIVEAQQKDADVLLGGVSWFNDGTQISTSLFWTEKFSGLQFTVVFRKFFDSILKAPLLNFEAADYLIASLTSNSFFFYPFISVQKEFGYSDATTVNNTIGRVTAIFDSTSRRLDLLKTVKETYKTIDQNISESIEHFYDDICIPTYVINLPERTERLAHIKAQFLGRDEFDVKFIEACKHKVGALGLWLSIRKIINMAISNDDDVIIICEDDHQFTEHYSKEYLLKNIIEAHQQGTSYLSGGTGFFHNAIPITPNRFWVGYCLSTQFVVIYKRFFHKILEEPYDEDIVADLVYSKMTTNKMVLYPFISIQKDFGYSDITEIHNESKGLVTSLFSESEYRLGLIQKAHLKYNSDEKVLSLI